MAEDQQQTEAALAALRKEHGVALMREDLDGATVDDLPAGVYGFAYAPAESRIPLFHGKTFQSFEVHKLPDGSAHLVGFVAPKNLIDLEMRNRTVEVALYPEPWGEATRLASLPLDEIVPSRKGPSRSEGNYLMLRLA